MDLVLKSFQKTNLFDFVRTFSIPIGIMILIAMMVIPLSPWQLDILFTSNLLVSLLVVRSFFLLIQYWHEQHNAKFEDKKVLI